MYIPDILYKYGFGVKSLGFDIFEAVCAELKISYFLVEDKLLEEGISFPRTRRGRRFQVIILQHKLPFTALAEVAWHEFAHTSYEHYGVRFFVQGSEDRYEAQADDLALCCLIPTLWIRTKTRNELLEEGFTNEQIDRRKWIYDNRGI